MTMWCLLNSQSARHTWSEESYCQSIRIQKDVVVLLMEKTIIVPNTTGRTRLIQNDKSENLDGSKLPFSTKISPIDAMLKIHG